MSNTTNQPHALQPHTAQANTVLPTVWQGRRVVVTGHTGFKGSWLCLWLQSLGAKVYGLALPPPTQPSLFHEARVGEGMHSHMGDIRDLATVQNFLNEAQPSVVFHMAAQPLVRYSYQNPLETYATNVMGTAHVLEAARHCGSVQAVVNITTDKCYENREWLWGYRENEALGGHDPYSSSKACAELVTSAYRLSFLNEANIALASVRAGNVIGGGDWAAERLVPDVLRAFEHKQPVLIRNPSATRPWQHVLEPLCGYLVLAQAMLTDGPRFSQAWNFGPNAEDARPVRWIVEHLCQLWGEGATWQAEHNPNNPHEAHALMLDISKVRMQLGWEPRWNLATALMHIHRWHRAWLEGADARTLCLDNIEQYLEAMPAL